MPFAGWSLPIHYDGGIRAEHLATRGSAGLFDVSHMGQAVIHGDDPAALAAAIEALLPIDLTTLAEGRTRYSLLLNHDGGIGDDLMITRLHGSFYVVVNAARTEHDLRWFSERLGAGATISLLADQALLALQGPQAAAVLATLLPATAAMVFLDAAWLTWQGHPLRVCRCGYTGEDGFEISLPGAAAPAFASALLADDRVTACGLGARDTLRLEAGLPLWGQDIDATTTPAAAGLGFAVNRRRRREGGYTGADRVNAEFATPPARRRVGLTVQGRCPVRAGTALLAGDEQVGTVTSGGIGASFGGPVAMGYVERGHARAGTGLDAEVRGRRIAVTTTQLPFVPHRYHYRGAGAATTPPSA